jgi:hypothetical protein
MSFWCLPGICGTELLMGCASCSVTGGRGGPALAAARLYGVTAQRLCKLCKTPSAHQLKALRVPLPPLTRSAGDCVQDEAQEALPPHQRPPPAPIQDPGAWPPRAGQRLAGR